MKLFLCFVLALKLVSAQYQSYGYDYGGYNVGQPQYYTFDQHQLQQHQLQQHQLQQHQFQQHQLQQPQQHQQQFAAGQYDQSGEPIVGSPLLPGLIGLQLAKPFMFGVPGLRMSKLNMGRIGGLSYANSLLGAANPNAQEESSADPNTMAYQYAADDYQFNQPAEQQSFAHGANAEQEVAAPQYYQQAQAAQGANQEFWPHWHWANQEQEQVSAPMYSPQAESQVGAQPANQQFGHHWHFANPEQEVAAQQPSYQANDYSSVGGSQYNQFQPIVAPQQFQDEQSNANERWSSWGDNGKKEYKKVVYQKEFYKPVINKDPCAKCDCKKIYKHDHDHHDFHKTKGITKIITKGHYEHKPEPHAPTYAIAPSSSYGSQYGSQYGTQYGPHYGSQYSPYVSATVSSRNDITTSTKKPEAAEKNEVEEKPKTLKITTTHAPSTNPSTTTTTTTTTGQPSHETTEESTTTRASTEKSQNAIENFFSDVKSGKIFRKRRDTHAALPSKRCINFGDAILTDTILGASNPNINEDSESDASDNCESDDCRPQTPAVPTLRPINIRPEKAVAILERVSKPYLGMVQEGSERLWSNNGIIGRFVSPIEETYLEFVKNNEYTPHEFRIIT